MAGGSCYLTSSAGDSTSWGNWVTISYASNCYDQTTAGSIWAGWASQAQITMTTSSSSTIDTSNVWGTWVNGSWNIRPISVSEPVMPPRIEPQTLREMERIAARHAKEQRKQAEERRKEKEAAESVALELLMELIGEKQLAIYQKTGRLLVKGSKCDYLIHRSRAAAAANVTRVEKDKLVDLCVHLPEYHEYCDTDNVIALKLAIEADEHNFQGNVIRTNPRPAELPLAANG